MKLDANRQEKNGADVVNAILDASVIEDGILLIKRENFTGFGSMLDHVANPFECLNAEGRTALKEWCKKNGVITTCKLID